MAALNRLQVPVCISLKARIVFHSGKLVKNKLQRTCILISHFQENDEV